MHQHLLGRAPRSSSSARGSGTLAAARPAAPGPPLSTPHSRRRPPATAGCVIQSIQSIATTASLLSCGPCSCSNSICASVRSRSPAPARCRCYVQIYDGVQAQMYACTPQRLPIIDTRPSSICSQRRRASPADPCHLVYIAAPLRCFCSAGRPTRVPPRRRRPGCGPASPAPAARVPLARCRARTPRPARSARDPPRQPGSPGPAPAAGARQLQDMRMSVGSAQGAMRVHDGQGWQVLRHEYLNGTRFRISSMWR